MNIAEEFRAAWVFEAGWHDVDLLPTVLARAAARVLTVDAAGISLLGGRHRVPLGATTSAAAAAERWQFTVGEGPCFSAYRHGEPVIADEATMAGNWPVLYDQFCDRSPYRSVVALPLSHGATRTGAMDLYFTQSAPGSAFDLDAARAVATLAHTALVGAAFGADPVELASAEPLEQAVPTAWLDSPEVRRRQDVWVAIGMCNATLHLDTLDALALLRARAYSREQTVDDLADDLTHGRVPVEALREPAAD